MISVPSSSSSSASLICKYASKFASWKHVPVIFISEDFVFKCSDCWWTYTWSGRLSVWGTVTDKVMSGSIFLVSLVSFSIWNQLHVSFFDTPLVDYVAVRDAQLVSSSVLEGQWIPAQKRTRCPSRRRNHSFQSQPARKKVFTEENIF